MNTKKAQIMLGLMIAVLGVMEWYLFSLSPESVLVKAFLYVAKAVLVLFLLSAVLLSVFLWSDDFYHTPYARYMGTLWNSWTEDHAGISLCKASWLGFFTLSLWLVMLGFMYSLLHIAYSVGMGGYEHFPGWNAGGGFASNIIFWAVISLWWNLMFGACYTKLVMEYKKNRTTVSFLVLFILGNTGVTWIIGGIHTFGLGGVLTVLYWTGLTLLALGVSIGFIVALAKLGVFRVVGVPIHVIEQKFHNLKEGICPIIPHPSKPEGDSGITIQSNNNP